MICKTHAAPNATGIWHRNGFESWSAPAKSATQKVAVTEGGQQDSIAGFARQNRMVATSF